VRSSQSLPSSILNKSPSHASTTRIIHHLQQHLQLESPNTRQTTPNHHKVPMASPSASWRKTLTALGKRGSLFEEQMDNSSTSTTPTLDSFQTLSNNAPKKITVKYSSYGSADWHEHKPMTQILAESFEGKGDGGVQTRAVWGYAAGMTARAFVARTREILVERRMGC
jgi:hypothetical protein